MNILITPGETAEKIDAMRKITNSSTGAPAEIGELTFASYDLTADRAFLTAAHRETFALMFKRETTAGVT